MNTNAKTLRNLVIDNRFDDGRLTEAQLGKNDYKELSTLYTNALESLTQWASKDYAHTSTKKDKDTAFASVKAILGLYATDESRVIIDEASLRTLRDFAVKPKRMYSDAYKIARKLVKKAEETLSDRISDLENLGIPAPKLNDEDFELDNYVKAVRESSVDTKVGNTDMLDMFVAALNTLVLRNAKIEEIKKAGNWTWKRPQPVALGEFATLVENYVGDCLEEGFNLKSYKDTAKDNRATNEAINKAVKEALDA